MDWFLAILVGLLLTACLILAWRYYHIRQSLAKFNSLLRRSSGEGRHLDTLPSDFPGVEDLSNAVKNLAEEFTTQLTAVEEDRARLSSILEKMTDGVIIADEHGQVTFINPAAQRIFGVNNALGHRVTEVLHHFQLVEAWQRCITTRNTQDETVELPTQRFYLHLIAIPDSRTGDVLLLLQDLTPFAAWNRSVGILSPMSRTNSARPWHHSRH